MNSLYCKKTKSKTLKYPIKYYSYKIKKYHEIEAINN